MQQRETVNLAQDLFLGIDPCRRCDNIFRVSAQVVEDGYEFFAKRQLVTLFSAPNYCGEFDNAGGMMSVDESLMCSFQVAWKTMHANGFKAKSEC